MELWKELDLAAYWKWVKAYNDNVHNEEVDRLARQEQKTIKAAASTKKLMFLFRYKFV